MLDSTLDLITQAASNSLYVFCFCNLIIIMIVIGSKPASYFDQESEIQPSNSIATNTNTIVYRNANDHKQFEDDDDAKCEQETSPIVFSHGSSNPKKELAIATATATDEKSSCIDHQKNRNAKCERETSPIVCSHVTSNPKKELAIATATDEKSSCIDHQKNSNARCERETSPIVFSHVSSSPTKERAIATDEKSSCIDHQKTSKEIDSEDELRRRVEDFIENVNRGWRAELLRTSDLI